jgi:hypothetical protein
MKKLVLLVGVLISLNSCALLFNGTKQSVNISANPVGTKIYVDGELAGSDNVRVKLRRKEDHTINAKKDGFQTANVNVESNVQAGWIVFDALFNWCAFLTDAPTGAWKSFDKSNYIIELLPEANK